MFFTNEDKISFGSTMLFLDKRLILGDTVSIKPIALLKVLTKLLKYTENQYALSGNQTYYTKSLQLKKNIKSLAESCSDVCLYRERFVQPNICTVDTI